MNANVPNGESELKHLLIYKYMYMQLEMEQGFDYKHCVLFQHLGAYSSICVFCELVRDQNWELGTVSVKLIRCEYINNNQVEKYTRSLSLKAIDFDFFFLLKCQLEFGKLNETKV